MLNLIPPVLKVHLHGPNDGQTLSHVEQFEKLETKVATKDCISNLLKTIEEQSKKISILEDRIAVMESHISRLRRANDNAQQYQRRL